MATSKPKPSPSTGSASAAAGATARAQAALAGIDFGSAGQSAADAKAAAPVWWTPAQSGPARSPFQQATGTGQAPPSLQSQDVFLSRDSAYKKVWDWYGTPQFEQYADYLVSLGLISEAEKTNPNAVAAEWYDAVDTAANMTASGKKVSPWDATRLISGGKAKTGSGSGGSGGQAGTQTSTTRTVNLTDPQDAKALINDVLSKQLGRAARPEEIAAFTQVLNTAQQSNPSISTETRTYDAGGNYTSNVQTSGGLDQAGQQQVISDKAMQMPEYGALQASTTYLNAFNHAIQSPVPG